MTNTQRQPLILLILGLPIKLIRIILYITGSLSYLPIYFYCLILKSFLFSPSFDVSPTFYLIFSIPRAILSLGGFAIGAVELYFIIELIKKVAEFGSKTALIVTLISIIGFTLFSFRFGYKLLFNKLKFPQLKSVKEHLELTWFGIQDILSLIFSLVTILLVFRIKELWQYQGEPGKRMYFKFSFRMMIVSFYDVACVIFWVTVWVLHWRYGYTRRVTQHIKSEEQKFLFVMSQAFNALFDLVFIPFLVMVIASPFLKGRRLLKHMNKLSVIAWRRLIFDETMQLFADIPAILCMIVSTLTVYEIPLVLKLYKNTLKQTKPYDFKEDKESLEKKNDHQEQAKVGIKIHDHIKKTDYLYRAGYLRLLYIAFIDILMFLSYLVITVSVYRLITLRRRIAAKKVVLQKKESANKIPTSYKEYRTMVYSHESEEEKTKYVTFNNSLEYPYMVINELGSFLLDLPVIALGVLLLIAPWRLVEVVKKLKISWKVLGRKGLTKEEEEDPMMYYTPRVFVLWCVFYIIIDYLCLILAVISLLGFWRLNFLIPEVRYLLKSSLATINKERKGNFMTKFEAFDSLFWRLIKCLLTDLIFLPVIVIFAPFYLICFWRIITLVRCLKTCEAKDFAEHRSLIMIIGFYCLQDLFSMIALAVVCLTVVRISTLKTLTGLLKAAKATQTRVRSDSKRNQKMNAPREYTNKKGLVKWKNMPAYSGEVFEEERIVPVFKAARKCTILLALDVISIPSIICCLLLPYYFKKYRIAVTKLKELNKEPQTAKIFVDVEKKLIQQRFKFGLKSLGMIISGILVLISFCLLLWRFPTLFMIIRNKELRETLVKSLVKDETKQKKLLKDKFQSIGLFVFFCFAQVLRDIPRIPVFLALNVVTPWRSIPVYKGMYRYENDPKNSLNEQIKQQRKLAVDQFIKGLKDYVAALKLTVVVVTLLRLPFLVMIISKNRFPQSKLSHRLFKNQQQQPAAETKLSWLKCISISFKELCKDLPFLFLGLIIIVIAPWRIITIISIIASQVDRIPTQDVEAKKLKLFSRRYEIPYLFGEVLRVDAIQILKMTCITLTVHRIPKLLKILFKNFMKIVKRNKKEWTFIQEIDLEFKSSTNDFLKLFCSLLILVLISRIRHAWRRLKTYRSFIEGKKSAAKHKQNVVDQTTGEERLSFNDITWDTYGTICQFLEVKDLANLSQVNRKFNNLNQKDFYWEYQYKRAWPERKGIDENVTYQKKCARAYLEDQRFKQREPLSEESRDKLYGTPYILFEEAVESLKFLPHLILAPIKGIMKVLSKKVNFEAQIQEYFPIRNPNLVDISRGMFLHRRQQVSQFYVASFNEEKTWETYHLGLCSTIMLALVRYHCEMGYYLSIPGVFLIKKTSTGGVSEYTIRPPNEEQPWLQWDRGLPPANPDLSITKRTLLHFAQLFSAIGYIVFLLCFLGAFPYVLIKYFNHGFFEALSGTYLVIFILHFTVVINVLGTLLQWIERCAPYFRPHKAISDIYYLNKYIGSQAWKHVGKPIFDKLSQGIKIGLKTIRKVLTVGYTSIMKTITWIFRIIMKTGKGLLTSYGGLLRNATVLSLKFGIIGDLFLTIFAIAWMMWPLLLPIFVLEKIYFIPFGLLSTVQMFIGYKIIQKASNSARRMQ